MKRNSLRGVVAASFTIFLAGAVSTARRSSAQDGGRPPAWQESGVLALANSPHARLRPVPVRAVKLDSGFWSTRLEMNREVSLPTLLQQLEAHGVVDNFRRLSGRKEVQRRGPLYTDSDLYKWMEAAAFVLQGGDDPEVRPLLDRMIDEVAAAQGPDGYLNTYYARERAAERFTNFRHGHELYCLGHLIQAGIAHHRAAGSRTLLDVGIRFADYVVATLGPGRTPAWAGHPEVELALVELSRTTGDRRYLDFAGYLLNAPRPELGLSPRDTTMLFSGIPFASRKEPEGHAVRAMYAASGATDYFMETGDQEVRYTLDRLWQSLTGAKMYVTGGVGSRHAGEAIGDAYELPNARAYSETCAAIGNYIWNWRLLHATGEARYADVAERALYNTVLSGVSLAGDHYFYRNPLASRGDAERQPWYDTTCCPPNIQRTLASLPGYFYSTGRQGLWVHFYHDSTLDWRLEDGRPVRVVQETGYPWDGAVRLTVSPAKPGRFSLFLRIPGWAPGARVRVNDGPAQPVTTTGAYHEIGRDWRAGDRVHLELDMPVTPLAAHPQVRENSGRVAVTRGPLVYCLEGVDLPAGVSPSHVSLVVDPASTSGFDTLQRRDLLGGITAIRARARVSGAGARDRPLYEPLRAAAAAPQPESQPVDVMLIPYYAWANRGPSPMEVWLGWVSR